jgi:single-strand DNA-binding protein
MIKLQVIGHLGKDCLTNTVNGRNVINFTVAHSERYKDAQGNMVERTTWVECAYWTDRTAIVPYLRKGQQVYVEGTPSTDHYQNAQGVTMSKLKLNVREVQLLGKAENNNSNNGEAPAVAANLAPQNTGNNLQASMPSMPAMDANDSDLPF